MFSFSCSLKVIRAETIDIIPRKGKITITKYGKEIPKVEYTRRDLDFSINHNIISFTADMLDFTNLQWVLRTIDYPEGEIAALFTLGLWRRVKRSLLLLAEYNGQTFDITRLVKDVPSDLKKYEYSSRDALPGLYDTYIYGF